MREQPLDLDLCTNNEMKLFDERMGEMIISYKDVPSKEYLKHKGIIVKKALAKESAEDIQKFHIKKAMEYITGVPDGYLVVAGKAISTNPKSKNYESNWKEIFYKKCYKYLEIYANTILGEQSTYAIKENLDFLTNTEN